MTSVRHAPKLLLNSGYEIPQLGYGTWRSNRGLLEQAVLDAIDVGYRHIDCAQIYGNQPEIGLAIEKARKTGKVQREELFVTSKIWNSCHSYEKASLAIEMILDDLRLEYLDLCLIHFPMGYYEEDGLIPQDKEGRIMYAATDYMDTWKAMEDAVESGKIRSIGLSNFNTMQIDRVINEGHIKPAVLQAESHPYFPQTKLIQWCRERGIVFVGFSTLANNDHEFRIVGQRNLLTEPTLIEIGEAHKKTAAQVALRWAVQKGMAIIPKSVSRDRMVENRTVFDFRLKPEEMKLIDGMDINWRLLTLDRDASHPDYPFHEGIL